MSLSSVSSNTMSPAILAQALNATQLGSSETGNPSSAQLAKAVNPSSIVTLSQNNAGNSSNTLNNAFYTAQAKRNMIWEASTSDQVSAIMAQNISPDASNGPFANLGAALLTRFQIAGSDFSQSVLQPSGAVSNTAQAANPYAAMQTQLHQMTGNQIDLQIKTAFGNTVDFKLNSQPDGLAVQITSSSQLSSKERNAVAALAKTFQGTIDGLTAQPPQLAVGGLTQYDSSVISSVNLQVQLQPDQSAPVSLSFQANSSQRSINFSGSDGIIKLGVDVSNPTILGSQQQQNAAIQQYLQQFDQASSRGHSAPALTQQFKDAFSQMNSNLGTAGTANTQQGYTLADQDHAMLSGLADFNASVTQTATMPNPLRLNEGDSFSYQASQSTHIGGDSQANRSISQTLQSTLKASYHQPLTPGSKLHLSTDPNSQNYLYNQINDSSISNTVIAYRHGALVTASSSRSSHQLTHVSKFEQGKMTADNTSNNSAAPVTDLLSTLNAALQSTNLQTASGQAAWQQTLTNMHNRLQQQYFAS